MILEELIGSFVTLFTELIGRAPPLSRENLQRDYNFIFEDNPEQDEVCDGLIHREYEQEVLPDLPYYEEDLAVLVQVNQEPRPNFCESFLRSCKANVGLVIVVVFIVGSLIAGLVYLDMNTSNACIQWMHDKLAVPSHVRIVQKIGMCFTFLPFYAWFPSTVILLWGFREFRKNYLLCLFISQLVTASMSCVYTIMLFDMLETPITVYNKYGIPLTIIFVFSILNGAYLVARKFKKVNPATSYSISRIVFILSFTFLCSCLFAYIYTIIIIKYFRETTGRFQKAIIAAFTPGIMFPINAIVKYIAIRKCSEIIRSDRAFALSYFLRGCSIALYRTMQSGFQNIWLFIGLSLLHGVSNVLSKATLQLRIKIWKFVIKLYNRSCCCLKLKVQPTNSPRIRRFNADLEIQNILFEYSTTILSQAYLACYLVMSFDVPPWQVIKSSLIRIAISLVIDFVFNIISVFIQIHFFDIPVQKVALKYWLRHVTINVLMIIITVSFFGQSLLSVFMSNNYMLKDSELRNCTSLF